MSLGDWLSLAGLILSVAAIGVAIMIYRRQSNQSRVQTQIIQEISGLTARQAKQATALANLELLEKFGTISSRAERLRAIKAGTREKDLAPSRRMDEKTRNDCLELRAQIMYTVYDCLAVNEVYPQATEDVQTRFSRLMHDYDDDVWDNVPVLHGDRAELNHTQGKTLLQLFKGCLAAYKTVPPDS